MIKWIATVGISDLDDDVQHYNIITEIITI